MEMAEIKTTFATYPAYKDSGVAWLGEIPDGWDVTIAKHVLIKLERPRKKNGNTVVCSNHGYSKLLGDVKQGLVSLTQHDYQGVNKGDLLVHGMDAWHGAISISKHIGDCTSVVHVCDCKHNKTFIAYFLKMLAIMNVYKVISNGVRQNTSDFRSWQKFGDIQLLLPTREEQTAIANFLDDKTAKIDLAISQKEKLIALLKERKQIIIQQAVTKGLDPNVKMKDSGVEWIGEIPEGWEVKKVKNLFQLIIDPAPNNNDMELLSIYTDIGVKPRKDLEQKGNRASTTDGYWKVKKGDFIVNKLLAWMGAIGLSDYEGVTSPAYDILRPRIELDGYFYHLLFRTKMCSSELKKHSRGIMEMRLRLYFDKFGVIYVPFPPFEEQNLIVNYIKAQFLKIDQAIALQQTQIKKLKEYKATLIDSAVTGKIKVC